MFTVFVLALFSFMSCSEDRVTDSYQVHPSNWMDPYSQEWHGTAALGSKGQSCAECHNVSTSLGGVFPDVLPPDPQEYVSDVACSNCHSYPHVSNYTANHPVHILNFEWQNLASCQSCHGVDFAGGRSGSSCLTCHTEPGGPAACITCHGMPPIEPIGSIPPGAHGAHSRYACTECHSNVDDLSHIDALPADVAFNDAHISNANGFPNSYTPDPSELGNGTCATYCHSDLHQGAPLVAVEWATGQTITQCRGCHQVPPTAPFHPTENRCHFCHPHVDPNSNYNDANEIRFLDPSLHVNGVVNATFP
ncbi:CxxxxCH/CxxCH domain-containing protein [bacterium]|nr:CxxxxCH/CxxCH domain-containing protein [bacterium]